MSQRGFPVRPSGTRKTWSLIYRDPTGRQRWEGKFPTKGEAQDRLTELLEQIRTGRYIRRDPITFEKFAATWLESRLRIRGSTASSYASLVNAQWAPRIGDLLVSDLRLDHIEQAVRDMIGDELETKTIHNAVTLLRTMLAGAKGGSAQRRGYLSADPTLGLELPELLRREIVPRTKSGCGC